MLLPRSRNNILGAITAMPADKFGYKPTPEQMSFLASGRPHHWLQ